MAADDHDAVRRALIAQGARRISRVLETNHILDRAEHSLERTGKGLRVRVNHNLTDASEETVLTVKGPLQPGPLKIREENELVVEDAKEALRFFESLGYSPVFTFQKRRETWELGECKIELDELPRLGRFVEIEGPGESDVMAARDLLGLSEKPPIKASYVALLIAHLKQQNLPTGEVTFDQ